jgi:nitronate monooxygenase
MLRYSAAVPWDSMDGDWEAGPHYAGTSAALVHKVEPIAEILSHIESDAKNVLKRVQPSLPGSI